MPSKDETSICSATTVQEVEGTGEGATYLFASVPATPKDKPADILVRFQAVGKDNPAVEVRSVYLSSRCSLLETRRILHKFFSSTYDRGFIFLQHGKEVLRHRERMLRLIDVMPRLPMGSPTEFFKFPHVQYKKLPIEKEGRRAICIFAGVVFLCEKSTTEKWQGQQLRKELSGDNVDGFSFVAANVMSFNDKIYESNVDQLCELAALGSSRALTLQLEKLPQDTKTELFRDRSLATPLHYAAGNGHMDVAEILLGRFGRELLYLKDVYGKTPLHHALYRQRLEVASFLLHLSPDLQAKDHLGYSCSRLITSLSNKSTAVLLSRLEPSVLESSLMLHFLSFAFQTRDLAACKLLCPLVHPVEAPFYRPPLHMAAELGDADLVRMLMQQRKSPRMMYSTDNYDNISILSGETYLRNGDVRERHRNHEIEGDDTKSEKDDIRVENYKTIKTLEVKRLNAKDVKDLDIISDLDVILDEVTDTTHRADLQDSDGHLPFHYACQHGHNDVMDYLYYNSMNNKDFVKGLKLALNWKRFSTIQLLSNLRPEFNVDKATLSTLVKEIDYDLSHRGRFLLPVLSQTPLLLSRFVSHAAAINNTDILALLLNLRVPMAGEDFMGRSPLHEACQAGHEAATRFLLLHGADPNCRDWRGATPLHYACAAGSLDVVIVLASRTDTNLAQLDYSSTTPVLMAAKYKCYDVILYLVAEHVSRLNLLAWDANGDCVLNHLSEFQPELFTIVLEAAAKLRARSATSSNRSAVVRSPNHGIDAELLEAWSDPAVCPSDGQDRRADVQKRHRTLTGHTVKCLKCQKSFTTLNKRMRWTHLCSALSATTSSSSPSSLSRPQPPTSARKPVVVSVCPKRQGERDEDADSFHRTTAKYPLRLARTINECYSPLDTLIIQRKQALIPELLNSFPEFGHSEKSWYLAARLADEETLKHLHSSENFSKDTFTNLLHLVLLRNPQKGPEDETFMKTVNFLLKMGASPNYIPRRQTFSKQFFSPLELRVFFFMPLEIAAINNNSQLVQVLLEYGASASISFAVHLAALKGNLAVLQTLLPHWKEGRWKSFIKGFKDDANELVRVCTLESGLVQAVCASKNISMELLSLVKDDEKGVFSCKKILTHHMVTQIRPEICSMTSPTLMNRILYKQPEDVKGGEEICQHLYISNLLRCQEKYIPSSDLDTFSSFLVDNGCYLGEIRVSKKSTVHVVCETFTLAVKRRLWQVLESLLIKSGSTLWKCLVSSHHSCHRYSYQDWTDGGYPCLSTKMTDIFHIMPLHLLKLFFEIGKKVISRHDMKGITERIVKKENEENTQNAPTELDDCTPRPETLMKDVVLYHINNVPSGEKRTLLILSKLTCLFPDVFPATVDTIRFSSRRHCWVSAAGVDQSLRQLLSSCSTTKVVKQLRLERMELRLWTLILNVPVRDLAVARKNGLNLLHLACIQNERTLLKYILTAVVAIGPSTLDKCGMTPMDVAACKGNIKILDLLLQHGGEPGEAALVATCVGKGYMRGWQSASAARQTDSAPLEKSKCTTLTWLFQNFREKLDPAWVHPEHGTIFDVILGRQSWSVLEWALENVGSALCVATLAKCSDLDNLAYAPAELVRKICSSHSSVLSKMPRPILCSLLLRLSAFPYSRTTEQVLRKALSMKLLDSHGKAVHVLSYRGKHGETLLHNACRCGNASLVKCVVTAAGKVDPNIKDVRNIVDTPDKAGCTPLWYSLAYRFWKLAEYLIVNGARNMPKRAVPGLWNKRMFQEMSRRMSIIPVSSNRGLLSHTQIKRGNSSAMAALICPGSLTFFSDLYEDTESCDVSISSKVEKLRLKSCKARPKTPRRAGTPRAAVLIQDDMESVGRLMSPRALDSARNLAPSSLDDNESRAMSPRIQYPDDDGDFETAKENIVKKKRVRYLLSLVKFSAVNRCALIHSACSFGNTLLLRGISTCSLWSAQRDDRSTFSPFLFGLVNKCEDATKYCLCNNMGPYETDPFTDVLCFLIMHRYDFRASHKILRKLLNRFTIAKETIRGIKLMLIPRSDHMKKLWLRGNLLGSDKNEFDDEYIMQLIQMAVKHDKGKVSSRLLITMAATGQSMILSAILSVVEDKTELTEIFKRKVVHNATVLDLVFILSPSRRTSDQIESDCLERMKIINSISEVVRLDIAARTLSAAVRKNLMPMLELIVKDFTRNNLALQPPDLWYEALFKAAMNGEINFINTICVAEVNTKPQEIQAAMLKALCLACLRRHRHVVNRLLLFKMPLGVRIEGVGGKEPNGARLTLECAIEGGDSVVASLILQTMEETGMVPSHQDILNCMFMAFEKGMEAIVDNLLRFAHYASPSLITLKICHMLFLSAARRGSGIVCVKFLTLPDFNLTAMDERGFTALHYACMHGKMSLAKEIITRSDKALSVRTPEGWTPLDLTRAFGHMDLAIYLVTEFGAAQGYGFGMLMTQSWLKRFLKQNESKGENNSLLMAPSNSIKSRSLDIVTLVLTGSDMAAKSLVEVAQESVVACLLFIYDEYPLLHHCAKSGCHVTLGILMKLISAQPSQDLKQYLQKEVKGKIPLCVAIENCNPECVCILQDAYYPIEWRYEATGESILHFAAKTNHEEIIQMVTMTADNDFLQVQDNDGLIPASTSIALGNHATVQYFLNGLRFAEKLHHDHTTTTYWCVLCLLDCCIGWSRVFLEGREIPLNGKGRNIFQRHRTESGFCVYSHNGNKAHTSHILNNIHRWLQHGASKNLKTAALSTMQYSTNGFKSELFLLLSQMTRFEAMGELIRNGKTEIACYLYDKLSPALDMSTKVLHFINAAAFGREELVKTILTTSGDEMSRINYEGEYTALDVAVAFGHNNLLEPVSNAFETSTALTSLKFLRIPDIRLPLSVKWGLGIARVGDKLWRESMDYDTTRLTHLDMYLLKKGTLNSLPADLLPRDIMPTTLRGREIEVNHRSIQNAILELGLDDTYLTSLLVSKVVLGRYYDEVDSTSQGWKEVQKIIIHCVTASSGNGAKMDLQWKDLHDTVLVEKTNPSEGPVSVRLVTADFPVPLTRHHRQRDLITDTIIPSIQRQIREQLFGLDINVTIDWNTVDVSYDQVLQQKLLDALVGGISSEDRLAGLSSAITLCGETIREIEVLYDTATVENMLKMFSSVDEIQVKYLRALPKAKDMISVPGDGKLIWYFMMDEGRPKSSTSLFPLSIMVQMFYTVAVCLHSSIHLFHEKKDQPSLRKNKIAYARRENDRNSSRKNITLLVNWKSFGFLNRLKTLMHFTDTAVAPLLSLIGRQYKAMLRLEIEVHTITLRNTTSDDEAGMNYADGVLDISLHSYAITHKPWTVSDIDAWQFFNELEVSMLSRKWRAGSVNVTASRHRAINSLLENIGFHVDLPIAGQNVLEMLCRLESRQMVHPYELLKVFGLALYKNIACGYIDSILTLMSFSENCYYVGKCEAPAGVYGWLRQFEAQPPSVSQQHQVQFLVYSSPSRQKKPEFSMMTKSQLQKLPRNRIFGLWEKISATNCHDMLRHPQIGNAQMIVVKSSAFLTTSATFTNAFLGLLPQTVTVGFTSTNPRFKCITFDEALTRPLVLDKRIVKTKLSAGSDAGKALTVEHYDYLSWHLAMKKGFNITFESNVRKQSMEGDEASTTAGTSGVLSRSFYIAYATYRTLCDVSDLALYDKQDREVIKALLKNAGTISVGPSIPNTCLELIQGEDFDEHADVYLISDRDIHVLPLGPMWRGAAVGEPYPQTLLVGLCNMFLQQTKSRVSSVLAHNLHRSIDPNDIKFKERVTSADQVSSLAATRSSVKALEASINRILGQSTAGTRKLKMDLTGVEFSEHRSGPMVSFDAGVLKCPLFSRGAKVDQRAMDRAFLFAVDEETGRKLTERGDYDDYGDQNGRPITPGFSDLFSVTSSEVCTMQKAGESVLEKQRIPKHHSDDMYVRELAVKRLFSGVEIGRTSDIVDSLDIGANVNSLNENGETPLIVAAKSRNYTIIDLLLTRGAALHSTDPLGVTSLHYEAGQGDNEAVKLMLSYGANPNAQDHFGRTPLHYAVVGSHQETVDLLVFCGADSAIINRDGESPKSLTKSSVIRYLMRETDLIIKGIKSGNVAIEHLTLQADTIYRMMDTGLTIRTPSGMGLAKTSLMVRRVVPEYSYFGPQPSDPELLISDVYDFRISGAYVEEPLLLQIPVYSRAEQYEDIFVRTDQSLNTSPLRVARVVDANKVPQWHCHTRICLHGVRSIVLVAKPRSEKFKVTPSGLDFRSSVDPLVRAQFREDTVQEDCEMALRVTNKPSYEEEEFDSILSMSHFYELSSTSTAPLRNDIIISLPLPENYLGHGILHVLMNKQVEDGLEGEQQQQWEEILRNPDYARDSVKLKISQLGQLCLLERNPQYPIEEKGRTGPAAVYLTSTLYTRTRRREFSACVLAMGKPRVGAKSQTEADVVVECVLSSKIHARLQHWKTEGFVDLKPSHTLEFTAVPRQAFVVKPGGCCERMGIDMPPLQFHPKRNNCLRFTVQQKELKLSDEGHVKVILRTYMEMPRSARTKNLLSRSYESLVTDIPKIRHKDEMLATIPLFLPWTASPGDLRGQESLEKLNLSPFDTELVKTDIRGLASPLPPEVTTAQPQPSRVKQRVPTPSPRSPGPPSVSEVSVEIQRPLSSRAMPTGLLLKPGAIARPEVNRSTTETTVTLINIAGKHGKVAVASENSIRVVTPSGRSSRLDIEFSDSASVASPSPSPRPSSQEGSGLLEWLAKDMGDDWFRIGVLLGVPFASLQSWRKDGHLGNRQKALKMLQQWKLTRSTRQDHGVPELLVTLQRIDRTQLVRSLKEKLRAWIAENLERRGCLKGFVDKNLLQHTVPENIEPMSPLFLLSLVRKVGFSLDLVFDLGLSRPEVSRVMTDPLLRHREDKMLGLLVICRDKEASYGVAMANIIRVLTAYSHKDAVDWILTVCRQWLMNQGSADDPFAHSIGEILQQHSFAAASGVDV